MEKYIWVFMLAFAIVFVLTAVHFDDKKKKTVVSND